ncbi:PadR family transcriptional regulator [Heyndrickxia sp. NPDC080065]|uniref:PadR family transcriptional regulator n=1 Tax=Heyndrickxia sp. NPDC080065 TaxID=3390568 RepID=UPI003D02E7D2
MSENIRSDFIRGHIDTIILRVLMDKDNYGYEIIKAIGINSNGQYELKEPSLYTSLKRLENQKLIESYWGDESQGGRRKYYKITQHGKEFYEKSLAEWKIAKKLIDQLIERSAGEDE